MEYLYHLLLYFAFILADETLSNLLFYLYLLPMFIFMLSFEGVKSLSPLNKIALRYSQLAISIAIGLTIFNFYSFYYLLIMIPLLMGFHRTKIIYLLRMYSSWSASRGIFGGMLMLFLVMMGLTPETFDSPDRLRYAVFINISLLFIIAKLMLNPKDFDIIGSEIVAHDMHYFHEFYAKPTVQNYINYINASQFKQAYAMLAPQLQARVTLESFTSEFQDSIGNMDYNEKLKIYACYHLFNDIVLRDIIYRIFRGNKNRHIIYETFLEKIKKQPIYVFQAIDSDVNLQWQIYDSKFLTLNSKEEIVAFCNPKKF